MNEKLQKLLESLKNKKVGVFCDDSNLYHSYKKYGWRVDFAKLKELLEKHSDLQFINYYIAIPNSTDFSHIGTKKFLYNIEQYAVIKKKDLKYTPVGGKFMKKGDCDVEIVLDVVRTIDGLEVVIIVSGDRDFYELKNYVIKDKNKNIVFMGYEENMAWELRQCWHIYLNRIKDRIVFKSE